MFVNEKKRNWIEKLEQVVAIFREIKKPNEFDKKNGIRLKTVVFLLKKYEVSCKFPFRGQTFMEEIEQGVGYLKNVNICKKKTPKFY